MTKKECQFVELMADNVRPFVQLMLESLWLAFDV